MTSRKKLKTMAKAQFKENYWNCVLAILLVSLLFGVVGGICVGPTYVKALQTAIDAGSSSVEIQVSGFAAVGVIALLVLSMPLSVGLLGFFVKNMNGEKPSCVEPYSLAFKKFGRYWGGSLFMYLILTLWSLIGVAGVIAFSLLTAIGQKVNAEGLCAFIGVVIMIALYIIPMIKAYSYSMVPYILTDMPNVKATEALKVSSKMMKGHKWQLFVLQLSFFGWMLLTSLTFGILGIFYVGPYMQNTLAAFYMDLRGPKRSEPVMYEDVVVLEDA